METKDTIYTFGLDDWNRDFLRWLAEHESELDQWEEKLAVDLEAMTQTDLQLTSDTYDLYTKHLHSLKHLLKVHRPNLFCTRFHSITRILYLRVFGRWKACREAIHQILSRSPKR